MDKLNKYRQIIKQILTDYSQIKPSFGDIERYTAFDNEQDRCQVISVGWENRHRVYGCLIHIDIKGDIKKFCHPPKITALAVVRANVSRGAKPCAPTVV
jgi:hypothetical protein